MKNKRIKRLFRPHNSGVLKKLIGESFSSVLPVTLIILVLCMTIVPLPSGVFLAFITGAMLLIAGTGVFTLGVDSAMTKIGAYIGANSVRSKKTWVILLISLIVGTLITVSEPDLHVMAEQVSGVPNMILIVAVSIGVGVFLAVAMLRTFLKVPLKIILLVMYMAIFALSYFVPAQFIPIAFDSGGVTTGPMSVPFIMSLGAGAASMKNDRHSDDDSFGLMAICSIGPIISVMILGLIYAPSGSDYRVASVAAIDDSRTLIMTFLTALPEYLKDVAVALIPIVLFYFLTMLFNNKPSKAELIKILIGIAYTYVGLTMFLLGVNVGFLPAGSLLGREIAALPYNWIIMPVGLVIGYFVVAAEPAVHMLNRQVGEITQGAIPEKALSVSIGIGVALSVGLSMARIYFGFSLMYILLPGYALILLLMFLIPDIFTAIAFDSGGVASGAMTASFVLPFAIGFCVGIGGDVSTGAFGVVALCAMMPILVVELLGLIYKIKVGKAKRQTVVLEKEDIIT